MTAGPTAPRPTEWPLALAPVRRLMALLMLSGAGTVQHELEMAALIEFRCKS